MAKYRCNQCGYQTNNKRNYDMHVNRKKPCNKANPNKRIRSDKSTCCQICFKNLSREDSLRRHMTKHNLPKEETKSTGPSNLSNVIHKKNNAIVGNNSNDNSNVIIGNNSNDNTVNIKPIINQNIIQKYDSFNINDLTLYEQYLSLTDKNSPYTALLNHLNLNPTKARYHNMYANIRNRLMDIHTGEEWVKMAVQEALSNVFCRERIAIGFIFNRFRIFLSNRTTKLLPTAYYYGYIENHYFERDTVRKIKLHLYNHRKGKTSATKECVPNNESKVWWALSKNFTWAEVEKLITKLDKYGIDLDNEMVRIKTDILALCQKKPQLKKFFKKLLLRIHWRIKQYKQDRLETSSEEIVSGEASENLSEEEEMLPADVTRRGVPKDYP